MRDALVLRIPRAVAERLEKESRRLGLSLEEYVLELILKDLDPPERAREYIEDAKSLLEQAVEKLREDNAEAGRGEGLGRSGSSCQSVRLLEGR